MEAAGLRSTTAWNFHPLSRWRSIPADTFLPAHLKEAAFIARSTTATLDADRYGLTNTYVTALAINSSNNIFAATFGGGAFRSTDNGDSWTPLNTGVPNATFLSLAINASGTFSQGAILLVVLSA